MMRLLGIIFLALAISGCASTSGLAAKETTSGYSGKRFVEISPHGVDCSSMICPMLGAQWDESTPNQAVLLVGLANTYEGITGAKFMIDGEEFVVGSKVSMTDFESLGSYKSSTAGFRVPLSLIRNITEAETAWLRLSTQTGYIEERIIDKSGDSKAFHALSRFINKIDGAHG